MILATLAVGEALEYVSQYQSPIAETLIEKAINSGLISVKEVGGETFFDSVICGTISIDGEEFHLAHGNEDTFVIVTDNHPKLFHHPLSNKKWANGCPENLDTINQDYTNAVLINIPTDAFNACDGKWAQMVEFDADGFDTHQRTRIVLHQVGETAKVSQWQAPAFGSGGGFSRLLKSETVKETVDGFVSQSPAYLYLKEGDTIGGNHSGKARIFTRVLHVWSNDLSIIFDSRYEAPKLDDEGDKLDWRGRLVKNAN